MDTEDSASKDDPKKYADRDVINPDMVTIYLKRLGGDKNLTKTTILEWRPDIDPKELDKVLDSLDDPDHDT